MTAPQIGLVLMAFTFIIVVVIYESRVNQLEKKLRELKKAVNTMAPEAADAMTVYGYMD